MPVHDWTRVEAGIFHAFHTSWIGVLQQTLNDGLLPSGFYALGEQHFGRPIADVLTLHSAAPNPKQPWPPLPASGGTALAEAPPRVRRKRTVNTSPLVLRRSLAIRHVSGHRLVALLEIVSPANKDRAGHIQDLAEKVRSALFAGIHVLLVDLFPPGPHDPWGVNSVILQHLEQVEEPDELPPGEPLTLASYLADRPIDVHLEYFAPGMALPDMPLFLTPDHYVDVPLEPTYQAAYRGMPAFWRDVLEGRPPQAS